MEECPEVQSDGCQHLLSFLAERGTEPFQVVYRHFVACNSPTSRKRKVSSLNINSSIKYWNCARDGRLAVR